MGNILGDIRTIRHGILVLAWTVVFFGQSSAQDRPLDLTGFVQGHTAVRTDRPDCLGQTECDVLTGELRAEIKVDKASPSGRFDFAARADVERDLVFGATVGQIRELYGDVTFKKLSVRYGRQIITWGVGDLLFINDTFPKNFNAFFTGEPIEYLKDGSDAIKVDIFPGSWTFEIVGAHFRRDTSPELRRFVFPSLLLPNTEVILREPDNYSNDLELSARLEHTIGRWEATLYASKTHFHAPDFLPQPPNIVGLYPRLNTYGFSLTGPLAKGVLNVEGGYYDSVQNRSGNNPFLEPSQMRILIGHSRQLWKDSNIGIQYYDEHAENYDNLRAHAPAGFPLRPSFRQIVTTRFTQQTHNQTLTFSLFAFWGLSEHDRYLIPSVRYAFTDALWGEFGVNIFAGNRNGMFGALDDNKNTYLTIRYSF